MRKLFSIVCVRLLFQVTNENITFAFRVQGDCGGAKAKTVSGGGSGGGYGGGGQSNYGGGSGYGGYGGGSTNLNRGSVNGGVYSRSSSHPNGSSGGGSANYGMGRRFTQ